MKGLSIKDKTIIGAHWAKVLKLNPSTIGVDRFQTQQGHKTAIGVYEIIIRMGIEKNKTLKFLTTK